MRTSMSFTTNLFHGGFAESAKKGFVSRKAAKHAKKGNAGQGKPWSWALRKMIRALTTAQPFGGCSTLRQAQGRRGFTG